MRSNRIVLLAGLSLPLSMLAASKLPAPASMQVDFKQHVQPILAARCHSCHGSKQQQSGLRLDKRQNALRGGDYGPVIVPGKRGVSKLIRRLVGGDGGLQMPPNGALSNEEIGILRAWIDQGGDFAEAVFTDKEVSKPVDAKLRVHGFADFFVGENGFGEITALVDPGAQNSDFLVRKRSVRRHLKPTVTADQTADQLAYAPFAGD